MSKLLHLGMAEGDIVAAVTSRPRDALHLPSSGRTTSFRMVDVEWDATDSYDETRRLPRRIVPEPLDG
jgi:predicted amidohydrolase